MWREGVEETKADEVMLLGCLCLCLCLWGQGRKSDEIWTGVWFSKLLLDRLMSLCLRCFHIFMFYFTLSTRSSKGLSSRWPPGGSRDPWLAEMILQFSSSYWTRLQRRKVQNSRSLLLNDIFIHPSFMCKTPGTMHVLGLCWDGSQRASAWH